MSDNAKKLPVITNRDGWTEPDELQMRTLFSRITYELTEEERYTLYCTWDDGLMDELFSDLGNLLAKAMPDRFEASNVEFPVVQEIGNLLSQTANLGSPKSKDEGAANHVGMSIACGHTHYCDGHCAEMACWNYVHRGLMNGDDWDR